jgi:hypothetical protein
MLSLKGGLKALRKKNKYNCVKNLGKYAKKGSIPWNKNPKFKKRVKIWVAKLKKRTGANNPNWKGDRIGRGGLHYRFRIKLKKPKICPRCKKKKRLELTNRSGRYLNEQKDWKYLCRRCHMVTDRRLKTFIREYNKKPEKRNLIGRSWK